MATTAIFPLHKGKGRTVAKALRGVVDYMDNPEKTNDGEFISSYECAPETADVEFALLGERYKLLTGRNQGDKTVIGYRARQSFKPGEITPAEANRLGYELALRFTKGKFAFIVATHIDTKCIHNHLIWSSTRLDCKKKFRNFIGSAFALRRCSDVLCAENGYSVIEKPKLSPGKDYAKYVFGDDRPPSFQTRLRAAIDEALAQSPTTFEDFLALIRAAGIVAERRGKHMRFKCSEQKTFTRLETLGGDYTEEAIRERIDGRRVVSSPIELIEKTSATRDSDGGGFSAPVGKGSATESAAETISTVTLHVPKLLIDIEEKMRGGKGVGYKKWASVQNLKQMARTLIYLQERGLDDYNVLKDKTSAATARYNELSDKLKGLESTLSTNAALQKQIVIYSKTRATYVDYRKAGYSKAFRATHEADIILHQAAKKYFDDCGFGKDKKLPTVANLRAEYAPTLDEKKRVYNDFRKARDEMKELLVAKANVDRLLNVSGGRGERDERGEETRGV